MPTTLERTTVSHTLAVKHMLATAARRWPEATGPRELMLHLMAEGELSLQDKELEAAYTDAYTEWADSEEAQLWDSASNDGFGASK